MEVILIVGIVIAAIILFIGLSCCIIGFHPVGVAAGSLAACCQSLIGNVVKGSCFAIMTCLSMRGCFIAMIIIGALALVGFGIYAMVTSEWFQQLANVGESLQEAYDWAKNVTSKSSKKFLTL